MPYELTFETGLNQVNVSKENEIKRQNETRLTHSSKLNQDNIRSRSSDYYLDNNIIEGYIPEGYVPAKNPRDILSESLYTALKNFGDVGNTILSNFIIKRKKICKSENISNDDCYKDIPELSISDILLNEVKLPILTVLEMNKFSRDNVDEIIKSTLSHDITLKTDRLIECLSKIKNFRTIDEVSRYWGTKNSFGRVKILRTEAWLVKDMDEDLGNQMYNKIEEAENMMGNVENIHDEILGKPLFE